MSGSRLIKRICQTTIVMRHDGLFFEGVKKKNRQKVVRRSLSLCNGNDSVDPDFMFFRNYTGYVTKITSKLFCLRSETRNYIMVNHFKITNPFRQFFFLSLK